MSDFLSRLMARSFTDAPVIQPRVPAIFEPAAAEPFDEAPSSSTPAVTAAETPPPTHPTPTPPLPNLPSLEKTGTTKPIANVSSLPAEEHLPGPDAPAPREAPAAVPSPRPHEQRGFLRETRQIIAPLFSAAAKTNAGGHGKKPPETFARSRPIQTPRRNAFSPVEPRSSTPAPNVHVTIGRVEVRAVHSPAPAPKPAKRAPPKLALEDYLQKREGGPR
jgi:hypothetical protein